MAKRRLTRVRGIEGRMIESATIGHGEDTQGEGPYLELRLSGDRVFFFGAVPAPMKVHSSLSIEEKNGNLSDRTQQTFVGGSLNHDSE